MQVQEMSCRELSSRIRVCSQGGITPYLIDMELKSLMVDGVDTHHLSHNPVRNFLQIASSDPVMYSRVSLSALYMIVTSWKQNERSQ